MLSACWRRGSLLAYSSVSRPINPPLSSNTFTACVEQQLCTIHLQHLSSHIRLGDKNFVVAGPCLRNSLPADQHQLYIETGRFQRLLKTFLFAWDTNAYWLVFGCLTNDQLLLQWSLQSHSNVAHRGIIFSFDYLPPHIHTVHTRTPTASWQPCSVFYTFPDPDTICQPQYLSILSLNYLCTNLLTISVLLKVFNIQIMHTHCMWSVNLTGSYY